MFLLVYLHVMDMGLSKPSIVFGNARIKSIKMVWNGTGGDSMGCSKP